MSPSRSRFSWVWRIRCSVSRRHAYLGLLRFRQVSPELYLADFSPDFHLMPLVLPHFCERLPDQPFVIRDLKRDLTALHVPGRTVRIFVMAPPGIHDEPPAFADRALPAPTTSDPSASGDPFDALWRRYLERLTIPERRNIKLQRANMPKKYWKYLTERPE